MSIKPTTKILRKVRRGVQNIAYNNPFYQKILAAGAAQDRLYFTPSDLWPGDAQAGLALLADQGSLFDASQGMVRPTTTALRNLRAVGTDTARQMAIRLLEYWLENHDAWDETEWAPPVLGERISGWIGCYEFYAPLASPAFIVRLTASLKRQWKHLRHALPAYLSGIDGLNILRGLIYGSLNFPEDDKSLGLACDLLKRQLARDLWPDGGVKSRNPSMQLRMVQHLVDLRAVFRAAGLEAPDFLTAAVAAMVPVVKFYRHGDGGLALFHGGSEETPLMIDALIAKADVRSRTLRRLPTTGYEHLTAGRSLLIADAGDVPPRGYDAEGHAGLLSFEFGHGRERLIVNCGAPEKAEGDWRLACASTAAHSTLIIEDKNACDVAPTGGLGGSPRVEAHRYELEGAQCLEMTHHGYRAAFGLLHQRTLCLAASGEELQGRDVLLGDQERRFTLRWHLHPAVQALLAHSGQAALLRTPSGQGWRLRIESGTLEMEPSIYCGSRLPRHSLQLKVSGRTSGAETAILWTLTREKKSITHDPDA